MRLKAENKEKVRQRIVSSSGRAFRQHGISVVSLDQLMAGAELTRGAFYAHFKSKAALVTEVLRHDHPLLRMLKARDGSTPDALWAQMHAIFDGYLDPANLAEVHQGCTLASLTGEAAKATEPQKEAFAAALSEIAQEMGRGLAAEADFLTALVIASGAVNAAQAASGAEIQARILSGARVPVMAILNAARHPEGRPGADAGTGGAP